MSPAAASPFFLKRHQINDQKWDACVRQSEQPLVYALSWYLDVVAPNWCGLVREDTAGQYTAVMPVPVKWRLGFGFAYQPPFCQQLGVFAAKGKAASVTEMLAGLPAKVAHFHQNMHMGPGFSGKRQGPWVITERVTHVLDLAKPYEQLLKGYKGNLRRAIQKPAPPGFSIRKGVRIEPVITLFRQTRGSQVRELKDKHYQLLAKLVQVLQQNGFARILEAREGEELVAGALFVEYEGRIIYLFAGNSERARQTSANARLLDQLIRENAGKPLLLDFEGGNIPGIGHFFRSFGAVPVPFVSLKMNRLPWPVSRIIR